ncbi:MAG: WYL domain-containing protein [Prevotella sp.]|nr:WYL domain-containing protein [Prevotella sp.]
MPINKNALIRYKYLDKLLSDRHHYYTIRELTDKVNEMMERDGLDVQVVKRTIEKDLMTLQCAPFSAPIETYKKDGCNVLRYSKNSFSIFNEELSSEERNLLHEVLNTLGQFEGLAHFEWLEKFKIGLGFEERRQIISFSNNPYLQNSNLLGILYDNISNDVVINLSYHTFKDTTTRSIVFHPYLLKQYNDRWFLFGAADSDKKILTFALDRIDNVEPLPEKKYANCPDDLFDRFEDIVGVTIYEDWPVEHILCWVSDVSKDYVDTKPIHGSQTPIKGEEEQKLHDEYPILQGGMFFTLDCINNYELIRVLCSFGKDLIVLYSTETVANDVYKRISEMNDIYLKIRT